MPPLLRTLLAVLLGLGVTILGVTVFVGLAAALFLGADTMGAPPRGTLSVGYLLANVVLSFLAAVLGGWVAAVLAGERAAMAVWTLAAVLLVLGVASAVGASGEAMAAQPMWYRLLAVPLGAAGAVAGGLSRVRRVPRPAAPEG